MKKIFLAFIILVLLSFFFFSISNFELEGNVKEKNNCFEGKKIELNNCLNIDNLIDTIKFVRNNDFCDIKYLQKQILFFNSINTSRSNVDQFFINALTTKIYDQDSSKFNKLDFIYLSDKFNWAEKFKAYAEIDEKNSMVFSVVYDYWLKKIANRLQRISVENDKIKYNHNYRFLVNKCSEHQYFISIHSTRFDKFIYNLTNQKWVHLVNASWNQSSVILKLLFFLFLFITVYSYYLVIIKIFQTNVKN